MQILTADQLAAFEPEEKTILKNGHYAELSLGYDEDQEPEPGVDSSQYEDGPWIVHYDSNGSGWTGYFPTRADAQKEYDSHS